MVFGRRVAPTGLVYTFVVLMITATGQVASQNAECLYTKSNDDQNGWAKFGYWGVDVCSVAQKLMDKTCGLPHLPVLDEDGPLKNLWYTASKLIDDNPSLKHIKTCACDKVMFNLLSACAGCQKWEWTHINTTHIEWQRFKDYQNGACFNKTTEKRAVPWTPDPPTWAMIFSEDAFNPNFDTNTEQPIAPTPFDPTNNSSTSTASPAAEPSSTLVDLAQPTNSSGPPIGAIVGSVIGGLVLLGTIAGLAFWLHCRKRRARDVAPSSEFLKPEYYTTPPLLPAHERRESAYQDDMEDEMRPSPTKRHSWGGGLVVTRRHEEDDDDCEMLPPFTRGTYIGPSPHEKEYPGRRDTGDTDITIRTNNTTTLLLSSSSPTQRSGPSDHFS
ncbi:unnamed protein product [Rhizoctonia solani]|uniref:Uncharacterized protein n=1 Tax=Rhizoctonia solani TaxID=456999 RepID=A0A8H2XJ55_9AGAM|nr:unnamed protein product [Rhizoctonia solani]